MKNQQNFKLLTGSGTGLVKFAKGKSSRALKFSEKENSLLATKEKSSEYEIKPGVKVKSAPCLETFLVFPKDNDTKSYLRWHSKIIEIIKEYLFYICPYICKTK